MPLMRTISTIMNIKLLFQILKNAYKQDKPADVHLVCEELKRIETESVGGISLSDDLSPICWHFRLYRRICGNRNKSILSK